MPDMRHRKLTAIDKSGDKLSQPSRKPPINIRRSQDVTIKLSTKSADLQQHRIKETNLGICVNNHQKSTNLCYLNRI